IINDILDFSKIEANQLEIENVEFDVAPLLESTARLLTTKAYERGVELVCNVRPDVPRRVVGDPTRLRQVLTNLVGNAVKFTHVGEVELSARVEDASDGRACVRFAVRDTGIGIPPEQRALIFEPFKQA